MKKVYLVLSTLVGLALLSGLWVAFRGIPFFSIEQTWRIGLTDGPTPFALSQSKRLKSPILSARDITGVRATFVADPFLIQNGDEWLIFFEVLNRSTQQGDIAVASSRDLNKWKYSGIVLDEPFHLSFPYVFQWEGEYYFVPESYQANAVYLYKAVDFPLHWKRQAVLLDGARYVDPTLLYRDQNWWLFVSYADKIGQLDLYYADRLEGPYKPHPKNPLLNANKIAARSAGRPFVYDGRLYRVAQDGSEGYGKRVWAIEITQLNETDYEEALDERKEILGPIPGTWTAGGMHQIDLVKLPSGNWIATVDGKSDQLVFDGRF